MLNSVGPNDKAALLAERAKTTVYIAGPMRGIPDFNFPVFDTARDILVSRGFNVISPADIDREEKTVHTEAEVEQAYADGKTPWIDRDLQIIRELKPGRDCVCLLYGWEASKGARAEAAVAEWAGVRVIPPEVWGAPIAKEQENVIPFPDPKQSPKTVNGFGAPIPPGKIQSLPDVTGDSGVLRTFPSGATRDTATNKPQYAGYLSPAAIRRFGQYMLKHQVQSDGSMRASNNWKKGIPKEVLLDSALRHLLDVWGYYEEGRPIEQQTARDPKDIEEALCALTFNVNALLFEELQRETSFDREREED